MELREALKAIDNGIAPTLEGAGFKSGLNEKGHRNTPPFFVEEENEISLRYAGEQGCIRIVAKDDLLIFQLASVLEEELEMDDYQELSRSLFDLDDVDERDIRSTVNELIETIESKFVTAKGKKKVKNKTAPQAVTKSAVRAGAVSYDANTFAVKLCGMEASLKDAYQANIDEYGQFLAEDFFVKHGSKAVIDIVRQNDKQRVRRLFNILNEIYDDGTNEVQNLIVVTVFGNVREEPELLPLLSEYMGADLFQQTVAVNQYLDTRSGARSIEKMENPPKYKPKKKKKKGFLSNLMGGGGGMGTPPM